MLGGAGHIVARSSKGIDKQSAVFTEVVVGLLRDGIRRG